MKIDALSAFLYLFLLVLNVGLGSAALIAAVRLWRGQQMGALGGANRVHPGARLAFARGMATWLFSSGIVVLVGMLVPIWLGWGYRTLLLGPVLGTSIFTIGADRVRERYEVKRA
jgi:hypothetical protein